MKSQTQFIKILFLCALMIISGCEDSPKTQIKPDMETVKLEPVVLQKPLNCPVMLVAYSGSNRFETQDWLSFSFKKNPDFDVSLGDACKGDLKNIWRDLTRFEKQIENHMPYIKDVYSITSYMEYFPQTQKDIQIYMDKVVGDSSLSGELIKIDRSAQEGSMAFNMKVIQFIRMNQETYWMSEHAPIIESTLSNYGLEMGGYDSEKSFFCYHLFDVCKIDGSILTEETERKLDFEYMRPAFDWFSFQKPDTEIDK